jgi:hypothetical protein
VREPGVFPSDVAPFEILGLAWEADAGVPRQGEDQPPVVIGAGGDHPLDILGRHVDDPLIVDLGAGSLWKIFGKAGKW